MVGFFVNPLDGLLAGKVHLMDHVEDEWGQQFSFASLGMAQSIQQGGDNAAEFGAHWGTTFRP